MAVLQVGLISIKLLKVIVPQEAVVTVQLTVPAMSDGVTKILLVVEVPDQLPGMDQTNEVAPLIAGTANVQDKSEQTREDPRTGRSSKGLVTMLDLPPCNAISRGKAAP